MNTLPSMPPTQPVEQMMWSNGDAPVQLAALIWTTPSHSMPWLGFFDTTPQSGPPPLPVDFMPSTIMQEDTTASN